MKASEFKRGDIWGRYLILDVDEEKNSVLATDCYWMHPDNVGDYAGNILDNPKWKENACPKCGQNPVVDGDYLCGDCRG